MRYIIIGLGNYGSVLAKELMLLGNEVIGADNNPHRVDALKDKLSTAFIIDATDEVSLSVLPLSDVDVVIVTIGEDIGASIRTIALLKQRKVKHIYARAIDSVHKAVLEAFNLDRILRPEQDAARQLVWLLELGINVETFQVDEEYYVFKFPIPASLVGFHVNDFKLEQEFSMKILALKRASTVQNFLGVSLLEKSVANELPDDATLQENDELVCYGRYKDFQAFWKAI